MPAAKTQRPTTPPKKPSPAPAAVKGVGSGIVAPENTVKSAKSSVPPARPVVPNLATTPSWQAWLAVLVIILAGCLAYGNSLHGTFALDDLPAIKENPTIQSTFVAALHPPTIGQTVTGRPLVNLSFWANFKWNTRHGWDGFDVAGYHVVDLLIHILAGLALFGLVRRTLELPKLRARFADEAVPLALAAALLWLLHPLQTESVTYVSQRAESLMGLFYFTTFYCFARGTQSLPWLWLPLAVLSDFLGVFCKEVTITAPVLLLLYDFTFVAEKPSAVLRRAPAYFMLLVAMLLQGALAFSVGTRGSSAGFGAGLTSFEYARSQFPAIVHYLALTLWPHPLVLDYGELPTPLVETIPSALFVLALVAATGWLLWKRPGLGFLGAWFFVVLAPSSSVIPITTEIAAEHRMYVPLAALAVLGVLTLRAALGRRGWRAALPLAAMLGAITHARNLDYHDALNLWRDTVTKHPAIARAHENYGIMLADANRLRESVQEYETALRLRSFYPDCENNLGNALGLLGDDEGAAQHYTLAIKGLMRDSDRAVAYYNLGNAESDIANRHPDAIHDPHMQAALNDYLMAIKLRPDYSSPYHNIGSVMSQAGRYDEAINYYLQALQHQPVFEQAEVNLANSYVLAGHPDDAIPHYQRALQENPRNVLAHFRLGTTLYDKGNLNDALREFAQAVQLAPNAPEAHYYFGLCLAKTGDPNNGEHELQAALTLKPDFAEARTALDDLHR